MQQLHQFAETQAGPTGCVLIVVVLIVFIMLGFGMNVADSDEGRGCMLTLLAVFLIGVALVIFAKVVG